MPANRRTAIQFAAEISTSREGTMNRENTAAIVQVRNIILALGSEIDAVSIASGMPIIKAKPVKINQRISGMANEPSINDCSMIQPIAWAAMIAPTIHIPVNTKRATKPHPCLGFLCSPCS